MPKIDTHDTWLPKRISLCYRNGTVLVYASSLPPSKSSRLMMDDGSETSRLEALISLAVLDTAPERAYDVSCPLNFVFQGSMANIET